MLKVNMGGCGSFVNAAEVKEYTQKAVEALKVLEDETGAGNDFLGVRGNPRRLEEEGC